MATSNDSSGLVDRRSLRDLVETSIGGEKAPKHARTLINNTRRRRKLLEREKKRLDKELAKKRKSS